MQNITWTVPALASKPSAVARLSIPHRFVGNNTVVLQNNRRLRQLSSEF
jgi:hypothetical protein